MHHGGERRVGVPACRCVCISMYKQMYTHTYAYHTTFERGWEIPGYFTSHEAVRHFFCTSRCRFTFSCGSEPLTQNTERSAPARICISHYLFGLFAAGQHKHPVHSSWGTARENKHAHRHISCCAHVVSRIWKKNKTKQKTYIYRYIYVFFHNILQ